MIEVKDDTLIVRISERDKQEFIDKCEKNLKKKSSDVLREIVKAFVEDRLTIEPTEAEKGIYKS